MPSASQALGFAFEVQLQFFAEVRFAPAAPEQRSHPAGEDVPDAHRYCPVLASDQVDAGRQPLPLRQLGLDLLPAGPRQRVEPGPAVGLGGAPLRRDPALMLEPVQRRIERPLLDAQQLVGNLLDALGDRPAVHRLERDGAQDQEIEGALDEVGLVAHEASLVDCQGERRPTPPRSSLRASRRPAPPPAAGARPAGPPHRRPR